MLSTFSYSSNRSRTATLLMSMVDLLQTRRPLMRLAMALALVITLLPFSQSYKAHASDVTSLAPHSNPESPLITQGQAAAAQALPQDGFYLYGQAVEPDVLGSTYLVFEARDGIMLGAIYMPSSSFDCFYGNVSGNQLAMTIVNSYDGEAYPYAIALSPDGEIASNLDSQTLPVLNLDGFNRLDQLTENDQRMLEVCAVNYGDQVW